MPQLDKVTFGTQVFWLVVVFITLFLVVVRNYLPKLAYILKYRWKLEQLQSKGLGGMDKEVIENTKLQTQEVQKVTKEIQTLLTTIRNEGDAWFKASKKALGLDLIIATATKGIIYKHINNRKILANNRKGTIKKLISGYKKELLNKNVAISKTKIKNK